MTKYVECAETRRTLHTHTHTHTGSLCLAFILSILTFPTFSETLGNSPQCDNSTLHTTTGPATLNARWSANTIILNWQPGDDATFTAPAQNDAAYSCEYDGGITLPTAPTRSGYTFSGWRVVQSQQQQQCSLSSYYPGDGEGIDYGFINDSTGQYGPDSDNADPYTLTQDNTWAVEFNNGIIKGRALCSGLQGNNHDEEWGGNSADWTATESAILSAPGEKKYCWCAGTSFGNQCSVSSPSWVFNYDFDNADDCANRCAPRCAEDVDDGSAFRRVVFGVTQ